MLPKPLPPKELQYLIAVEGRYRGLTLRTAPMAADVLAKPLTAFQIPKARLVTGWRVVCTASELEIKYSSNGPGYIWHYRSAMEHQCRQGTQGADARERKVLSEQIVSVPTTYTTARPALTSGLEAGVERSLNMSGRKRRRRRQQRDHNSMGI